ncbi:hypothetical protein BGZ76_003173 [Entomortierella beljakovae]|nr:hypothetical protein BGZ76_003173 [Entomortierella beljakovae]
MAQQDLRKEIAGLPAEIVERIFYFTDGYTMSALGIDSTSSDIFHYSMFLSGGPGIALSEIFRQGGDFRALFTIRKVIPADLAIAKAVATHDPKMLARVFAVWSTTQSDIGIYAAMVSDFRFGVDNITNSPGNNALIRYRNFYYLNRGVADRIDESIDTPYLSTPSIDSGSPFTRAAYDKLYTCAFQFQKLYLAAKMGVMEDVYHQIENGLRYRAFSFIPFSDAIDYLPVSGVIDVYNRYVLSHPSSGLEELVVRLCKRVYNLEELDGIKNKDLSDGYSQASRYFTGTPGRIHPMLAGHAIDTRRDIVLDNIIAHALGNDEYVTIIDAMVARDWTLDMIMAKLPPGVLTKNGIQKCMGRNDVLGKYKRGLLSLDGLLYSGGGLKVGGLRDLDRDSAKYIITRKQDLHLDDIDTLLWVWREFGQELTIQMDRSHQSAAVQISFGRWMCSWDHQLLFTDYANESPEIIIDKYLCWRTFVPLVYSSDPVVEIL